MDSFHQLLGVVQKFGVEGLDHPGTHASEPAGQPDHPGDVGEDDLLVGDVEDGQPLLLGLVGLLVADLVFDFSVLDLDLVEMGLRLTDEPLEVDPILSKLLYGEHWMKLEWLGPTLPGWNSGTVGGRS